MLIRGEQGPTCAGRSPYILQTVLADILHEGHLSEAYSKYSEKYMRPAKQISWHAQVLALVENIHMLGIGVVKQLCLLQVLRSIGLAMICMQIRADLCQPGK